MAYLHGRNGDHSLVPFECDLCIFRKLRAQDPDLTSHTDTLLLAVIRRANLDAFWSSASSTVASRRSRIKASQRFSERLGLSGPYSQIQSLPNYDHCGYEVACQILLHSLNPGRNNHNHVQWDTIRQLRTCFSNFVRSSNAANQFTLAINDNRGAYQRIGNDVCGSFWFSRFRSGCKNRMGQFSKQNKDFSIPLLLAILEEGDRLYRQSSSLEDAHKWSIFLCYSALSYVISLRGNEVFFLDLDGLNTYNPPHLSQDHFVIALLGKIKGEANIASHLIPCINVTSSGIQICKIVMRVVKQKQQLGFFDGPALSGIHGKLYHQRDINDMLLTILESLYLRDPSLFPIDIVKKITSEKDLKEQFSSWYACYRSFRRTSDSRALDKKNEMEKEDVDIVNRWKTIEASKGKRPNLPMKQHYADLQVLLQPFLRYTKAM